MGPQQQLKNTLTGYSYRKIEQIFWCKETQTYTSVCNDKWFVELFNICIEMQISE
jgi:hypothetical protein